MKIELDENDLSLIDKINNDLRDGQEIPLLVGAKGKRYFFEFICEDVAKANIFATMFMYPSKEKAQELKDKFGITVRKISYCFGDPKKEELKRYLQKMLKELDGMN